MKKKLRVRTIFNVSVAVFSIVLLAYFCLSPKGLTDLLRSAKQFDMNWLFGAVFCHMVNLIIDQYLIYRFTKNIDSGYTFKNALKTSMVGQFFSAVTPAASGGQPMQVYVMTKQGLDIGVSTSSLIQKFLVYQVTLTTFSTVAIIFKLNFFKNTVNPLMWGLSIFGFVSHALVIVLLLLFSFNKNLTNGIIKFIFKTLGKMHLVKDVDSKIEKLQEQLVYFHKGNVDLFKNKGLVIETYALTILQFIAMFIVPYCIYRSFDFNEAGPVDMICAQSFVTMVSSFIPIPGGSGVSEGSFYVFFGMFFTQNTIKSAILLWRTITYYLTILISAPFSRLEKKYDKTMPILTENEG